MISLGGLVGPVGTLSDEHKLASWTVRGISNLPDNETNAFKGIDYLGAGPKAKRRVSDEVSPIGPEDKRPTKLDERLGGLEELHPGLDSTHTGQLDMSMGVLTVPLLPAFHCWITNLEDQMAARLKCHGSGLEDRSQLLICQEDLSDIACHGHQVNSERRKRRRITQDPPHMIAIGLPSRYFKRSGGGGVEPRNSDLMLSEKASECARSAPDVKYRSGAKRNDKGDVGNEIGSVGFEGVIDLRQSSILEDRIGHFAILAGCLNTAGSAAALPPVEQTGASTSDHGSNL